MKTGDTPPAGAEYALDIQGVYVFKHWASHDRTTWNDSHTLSNIDLNGSFDVAGLNANVGLDKN